MPGPGRYGVRRRAQLSRRGVPPASPAGKLFSARGGRQRGGRVYGPKPPPRQKLHSLQKRLAGLDPEQQKVASKILKIGAEMGASEKELMAAIETGLVESGLRNLPGGDRDSVGWRQERGHYGSKRERMRVGHGARRFFTETRQAGRGGGMSAGQLAQTVQRSAFPGRYDQQRGAARRILGKKGGKKIKGRKTPNVVRIGKLAQQMGLRVSENPAFDKVDPVHAGGSFHYQQDKKGRGLAIDVSGDAAKLAKFNKIVAKRWGSGLAELFHDPGINIKNGKPTGAIGGHGSHVHVAVAKPGAKAFGVMGAVGGAVSSGGGGSAPAAPRGPSKRQKLSRIQGAYRTAGLSRGASSKFSQRGYY